VTFKIPIKIEQSIAGIAADNLHGSTWLSRQALQVLAKAAEARGAPDGGEELADYLRAVARQLRAAQPTMSSLSNHLVRALGQMPGIRASKPGIGKLDKLAVRSAVEEELASQRQELTALGEYGAKLLAEKIPGKARLITLSASDAVLEILSRLAGGGLVITVAESRPVREGAEFAVKLAKLGFKVRLVTDAMLGIETVGADCVLTGADAVCSDGSVINKAGTRLMALAAKMDKVPYYCCTQTIKICTAQDNADSSLVPSQRERDPDEIQQDVAEGIVVKNLYFDRTEYFLVGGFISENGFLRVKEIRALSEKATRLKNKVLGGH
jgi:translation initiation factor 2B subunit (eIF-2B alpha/beta/delta family)